MRTLALVVLLFVPGDQVKRPAIPDAAIGPYWLLPLTDPDHRGKDMCMLLRERTPQDAPGAWKPLRVIEQCSALAIPK